MVKYPCFSQKFSLWQNILILDKIFIDGDPPRLPSQATKQQTVASSHLELNRKQIDLKSWFFLCSATHRHSDSVRNCPTIWAKQSKYCPLLWCEMYNPNESCGGLTWAKRWEFALPGTSLGSLSSYSPDLIHQLPAVIIFYENLGRNYHHLLN